MMAFEIVELMDPSVVNSITATHGRFFIASKVICKSKARTEIVFVGREDIGLRFERIRNLRVRKSFILVTPEVQRETGTYTDIILHEPVMMSTVENLEWSGQNPDCSCCNVFRTELQNR